MSRAHPPSPRPLALPGPVAAAMVAAARARAPLEACGVLVGHAGDDAIEVVREAGARNVHPRPADRFTVAPEDILAAEKRARGDGLEVVGFWHSHPSSGAEPSAVDRDAAWEGYSYLIVSLADPRRPRLASWRLTGGGWTAEEVVERATAARGPVR